MSVKRNNLIREVVPGRSLFPSAKGGIAATASCTWNQGDILAFDTVIRPVSGSGDAGKVLGVALQTLASGLEPSWINGTEVDAAQAVEDIAGPLFGSVFDMNLTSGKDYSFGDPLYLTTDPQTLTSSAASSADIAVGIYQGADPITAAPAGSHGDCLIGCTYGQAGLTV